VVDARRDLEDALGRLLAGQPQNEELRMLAEQNRLRISVASVSKEAGRSRTLIGFDDCAYPDVRKRVLAAMREGPSAKVAQSALRTKNAEAAELKRQLAESYTVQAMLVLELEKVRADKNNSGLKVVKPSGRR
jgi:hypothetical protein